MLGMKCFNSFFLVLVILLFIILQSSENLKLTGVHTGCPKKNRDLWKMVTEGHWVELELKAGPFLKNSGNSQSDRHQIFSI